MTDVECAPPDTALDITEQAELDGAHRGAPREIDIRRTAYPHRLRPAQRTDQAAVLSPLAGFVPAHSTIAEASPNSHRAGWAPL
jgi:hypothetical protein